MAKNSQIDPGMLVQQIRDGDSAAENELVSHYLPTVRFILRSRYSDPELVQDVLQDTFFAVIQNLRDGKLKNPAALSAYIRSVAINKSLEFVRKETRSTSTDPQFLDTLSSSEDLLNSLAREELAELVRGAIDSLAQQRDRELILKFYYYDMDKQYLCDEYGISLTHFDTVNARARERLQKLFEKKTRRRIPLSKVGLVMLVLACRGRSNG